MSTTIYVPDIECDSCKKLISKKLKSNNIQNFSISTDSVTINEDQSTNKALKLIQTLGYRASTNPFERKTFSERLRHFKEQKDSYRLERLGLRNAFIVFFSLLSIIALAYVFLWSNTPGFLNTYAWWLIYLVISVTSISVAVWHYTAYQAKFTCMTGMMIGMTFGMQTGMMLGAIIGATNGFFWGALIGMLLGTSVGVLTGRCCGVMGVMEGAMAGVMGGTMGAMITVMMLTDNVLYFMPFYMLINLFIIAGLSYMLYEEVVEGQSVTAKPLDTTTLVSVSVIITALLAALMIYGPSSSLLQI